MHPLVSAEVRELGVGLETDLTLERFHTAVDVLVLLQTTGCCKGLTTFSAGVRACPRMVTSDVFL